jgi:hypothetical protein
VALLAESFDSFTEDVIDSVVATEPRAYIQGILELSLKVEKSLPYHVHTFWEILMHDDVSVADIRAVLDSPTLAQSNWLLDVDDYIIIRWTSSSTNRQLRTAKQALLAQRFRGVVVDLFALDTHCNDIVQYATEMVELVTGLSEFNSKYREAFFFQTKYFHMEITSLFNERTFLILSDGSSNPWRRKLLLDILKAATTRYCYISSQERCLLELIALIAPCARQQLAANLLFMQGFTTVMEKYFGTGFAHRVVDCLTNDENVYNS